MWSVRNLRTLTLGLLGIALAVGLAYAATGAAAKSRAPRTSKQAVTAPQPATPAPPDVRDTRANVEAAFTNEMNAKERYEAYAKQADRDGYPAVGRLFRACGRAEAIHGDRDVEAIAWAGGQAKAVLDRIQRSTTAENLQAAIDRELYESTVLYPALLVRARADGQPVAVRSINFALSAEREHARLFQAALAKLDARAAATPLYVCPCCGKTVEAKTFAKCPNCFTGARRFIAVT